MNITRKNLRILITEAVSEELLKKYVDEYRLGMDQEGEFRMLVQRGMDPLAAIKSVSSEDLFDDEEDTDPDLFHMSDDDYYEMRRAEELDDIYYGDLGSLHQIIKDAQAIDYSRLVGEIRKNRYLSKYEPRDIKAMLAELIMQGSIDYDNESGQWTVF